MLEMRNVSLTVAAETGPAEILRDINLTFKDNAFYVLTGPNGGGKTSLAKVIMGIYRQTAGSISLNGQDISDLGVSERARLGIGYAFQQPPRFKGITVKELLKLAGGQKDNSNLLYDVGLCPQDYLSRDVDTSLSGGELKRIEIASLLARNLTLAIFDEPEAGIDLWGFSRLIETFQDLRQRYASTLIIISHQERILQLADEILLVADGTVVQQGSKDLIWPLIMNEVNLKCTDCKGVVTSADCGR